MVVVAAPPPNLSLDSISLFYVLDEALSRSPILVFYGPSATPTATGNNYSRIQSHIFTPAGFQSFPRLTISPTSPLYAAVNCLPREEQGDDICRGLAFSIFKYFAELPQHLRAIWESECAKPTVKSRPLALPPLFTDSHAAILASRMIKVENVADTFKDIRQALAEQSVSCLDVDIVLPAGALNHVDVSSHASNASDFDPDTYARLRYGQYAPIVSLFGDPAFLPTARLRRAPSRPTALTKSLSFFKKQKENIRREMCELLDTEENYTAKLHTLVLDIAADFRQKAKSKSHSSPSPSDADLTNLFPESLDRILHVNSSFLDALRKVVEDTENAAITDIEASSDDSLFELTTASLHQDLTGAADLAACLRQWFPKFASCYVQYTKAHSQFPQILKNFTKDSFSSFSKRIQDTGEQRLMSMLIEPVQRLPRYNLYIDNILKQLPHKHLAIQPLLKARDIITEICSQDAITPAPSKLVNSLRRLIHSWPLALKPLGRLVTAIDAVELSPPFRPHQSHQSTHCIILLFTDHLVILAKIGRSLTHARNLLALIDSQDPTSAELKLEDLSFKHAYPLDSIDANEADGGTLLLLLASAPTITAGKPTSKPGPINGPLAANFLLQSFLLSGAHEGKASRVVEDFVRARIEGRYPDAERDSSKWEIRSAAANDLTLFLVLAEETSSPPQGRGRPSNIQIYVEPKQFQHPSSLPDVDVQASFNSLNGGLFALEIFGPNEFTSKDTLTASEFLPVLSKRLTNVLQMKYHIKTSAHARAILTRNQQILQSLRIVTDMAETSSQKSRPASPVKLLANIFGGSIRDQSKKHHATTLSLSDIPQLAPVARRKSDDASIKSENFSRAIPTPNAFEKLEETLSSYTLALHARKGNIVGKVLRARPLADELLVNELYNTLLEDPDNYQLAAQVSVDVLFSAFEKFVKAAWQDKMGPLFTLTSWHNIQSKLDNSQPSEFRDTFRHELFNMSPQNQRAARSIVKLLVDLLEGTGNDGDRGILTASFAEVLVPDGNIHHFVALLDRLVEDVDPLLLAQPQQSFDGHQPTETQQKPHNTGSLSSTSSLRKKFGLLARMGSKSQSHDQESDSLSVWRTLSKSKLGHDSQPSSLSKATSQHRPAPNDSAQMMALPPKRPNSRDRPTVLGAFNFENFRPLSTIGESQGIEQRPRKKRRSSLSDLTILQNSAPNTPGYLAPRTPVRIDSSMITNQLPQTPSPMKQSFLPQPSPAMYNTSARAQSPNRRDNSPMRTIPKALSPPKLRSLASCSVADEGIDSSSPRRKNTNSSNIPTLRHGHGGLNERPISGNARKLPAPPVASDKAIPVENVAPLNIPAGRLRMQSPQKLGERLVVEQRASHNAQISMESEERKLRDDISSNLMRIRNNKSTASPNRPSSSSSSSAQEASIKVLESKLATIASKHATLLSSLQARLDSLASDFTSSLTVSEQRAKGLDELYREANAENEALYARFNDELAKVLALVKSGDGQKENARRVREVEEENAKLRKENGRLRREVVGLRAQLKE